MPVSLLPPDTSPTNPDNTTEEQLREHLSGIHTEALDNLRARVKEMRTSELIAWLSNPPMVAERILTQTDIAVHGEVVVIAAVTAIADEIDRRLPVSK